MGTYINIGNAGFQRARIAHDPSFEQHLNKYPTIYLDMTNFVSKYKTDDIVSEIDAALVADVHTAYPDVPVEDDDTKAMDAYVSWLRLMFKSQQAMRVFAGAYMTGILPIKKYKTESALNNFIEYSMVTPRKMAGYFGFTKEEVKALARLTDAI
ncbi:MAG: hypothetical protein IJ570_05975 [Prevotella sp.]|nr:hypothetical protein [Prevotella sp.]